jgi:hypothetical protein
MVSLSSATRADHCPFLNRSDCRCGEYLSLDRLGHAFGRCFGQYAACPVYAELLIERRVRRGDAGGTCSIAADVDHVHASAESRPIQLTIHRRALARASAAARHANAT